MAKLFNCIILEHNIHLMEFHIKRSYVEMSLSYEAPIVDFVAHALDLMQI